MAGALKDHAVEAAAWLEVSDTDVGSAARWFADLPGRADAVVGVGGGKALDVAKYVSSLGRLTYHAVPTSLSNDGFCSPQVSLSVHGKRRSRPCRSAWSSIRPSAGTPPNPDPVRGRRPSRQVHRHPGLEARCAFTGRR